MTDTHIFDDVKPTEQFCEDCNVWLGYNYPSTLCDACKDNDKVVPPAVIPQKVPRPLTAEEQAKVDKINAEKRAKEMAKAAPKLEKLAQTFGPKHPPKAPKVKKQIEAFDPFAPREAGTVDWEKQKQDTSQRSAGGKRKKVSGKK